METNQVRYFLTLCRELNFTRAAELCHVSQPALTKAIKNLEEELGGELFRRERGNTHLTDLGRLVKPHFEQVFAATETARAGLKTMCLDKLAPGGVPEQAEQCFKNLRAVLAAAGLSLDDVVKVNVYLVDIGEFAAMNAVYEKQFAKPFPARTTVAVKALPFDSQVEKLTTTCESSDSSLVTVSR